MESSFAIYKCLITSAKELRNSIQSKKEHFIIKGFQNLIAITVIYVILSFLFSSFTTWNNAFNVGLGRISGWIPDIETIQLFSNAGFPVIRLDIR